MSTLRRDRAFAALLAGALALLLPGMAQAQTPSAGSPAAPAPVAAKAPPVKKFFAGGGLGLSFGDVDYVSLTPWFGYQFNPRVAAGVGVEYAYRNDHRYDPALSTSDYGGSVFTRVTVVPGAFAAVEYEYLRYEYYATSTQKLSDDYSSIFVGGGLAQPMGGNAVFIASAMYNLSWSETDPSPYDSPWVISVGVSVGF
jgi:hypothetical protein